eukprot:13367564-Heterocapsa_arctica.AAC.1
MDVGGRSAISKMLKKELFLVLYYSWIAACCATPSRRPRGGICTSAASGAAPKGGAGAYTPFLVVQKSLIAFRPPTAVCKASRRQNRTRDASLC